MSLNLEFFLPLQWPIQPAKVCQNCSIQPISSLDISDYAFCMKARVIYKTEIKYYGEERTNQDDKSDESE